MPFDPSFCLVASNPRTVSQIPHSCVVLHDSRFAIIVDGTVVDAASSFLDDGSRHSLTVMGREFVLDCHATLPAPSTLGPNDIAAGSLNSKASLFKMHADASFVSDAATGISSPMKLHPIPRGSILHDGATTPAPSQQSNAKREHYALYGTIIISLKSQNSFQKNKQIKNIVCSPFFGIPVDGELIQPDIETRMPQPYLALGRHIQHRALKTAGSRQSADC